MNIKIRRATLSDASTIASIHIAAWRKAYANIMPAAFLAGLDYNDKYHNWRSALTTANAGRYIVAELSGKVAGFAVYGPARDKDMSSSEKSRAGELVAINIDPAQWSQGLGAALVEYILAEASEEHWSTLYLWVIKSNQRAIALYNRYGFQYDGNDKIDRTHCDAAILESRYVKYLTSETLL